MNKELNKLIKGTTDFVENQLKVAYIWGRNDGKRWVPVTERLPEDGRPVLIYAWSVHYVIARYDEFRTESGYKKTWVTADAWNGNTEIKHEVIAWMPLPEPYREEDKTE